MITKLENVQSRTKSKVVEKYMIKIALEYRIVYEPETTIMQVCYDGKDINSTFTWKSQSQKIG